LTCGGPSAEEGKGEEKSTPLYEKMIGKKPKGKKTLCDEEPVNGKALEGSIDKEGESRKDKKKELLRMTGGR